MSRPEASEYRVFLLVEPSGRAAADAWFESRGLGLGTFTSELFTIGGDLAFYCCDTVASARLRGQMRGAFGTGRRKGFDRNHMGVAPDRDAGEETRAGILSSLGVEFRPGFR